MKAKLLVFFGIVAIGACISVFTLTRGDRDETGEKPDPAGPGTVSTDINRGSDSGKGSATATPPTTSRASAPETVVKSPPSAPPANTTPSAASPPAKADTRMAQSTARNAGAPDSAPSSPGSPAASPAASPSPSTGFKATSPEGVLGGMTGSLEKRNFQEFLGVIGNPAIPAAIKEKLKAIIENPNLKLDPDRPFWEVAKTRDSVRWMLNFVPARVGVGEPQSVIIDIAKLSPTEYRVSEVSLPPTLEEVLAAIGSPQISSDAKIDSLNVAQVFSKAVLSEDFISARKLCSAKVTDERIAGLMIALEEGRFTMREDRPLIVTFSRDAVSWILSRVDSPEQSSEFALELENEDSWQVSGLTFGKVIATLAREADGPYSPIVEDPTGGESLVVYFEFDEDGLTSRADTQLKIVANILKQDKTRKIRITGHADALGSDDYNRELSSRRAEAIREGIISRGVSPNQVITEGYGESRPRKPNFMEDGSDNPSGRSENRRAEVYLDF